MEKVQCIKYPSSFSIAISTFCVVKCPFGSFASLLQRRVSVLIHVTLKNVVIKNHNKFSFFSLQYQTDQIIIEIKTIKRCEEKSLLKEL